MSASTDEENELISLVYISSSVGKPDEPEILEILRTSRRNNEQRNITGMLLYQDGNFMQVLEGPNAPVAELIETVKRDNRHRGLIVLIKKSIKDREFPSWSMAFRNLGTLSAEDKAAFSTFLSGSFFDEDFRRKPDLCYKLLLAFKDNMR